ncbi:MAG: hypothetical protein ACRCWJ_15120 [Casimicrobium sp.]
MGASRVYSLFSPYSHLDLSDVAYEQTDAVMYTVSLDKEPMKLVRDDHTEWTWGPVTFGPVATPPTGGAATPFGSTSDPGYTATTYRYKLTTTDGGTGQESRPSTMFSCVNDLTVDGHYNTISWTPQTTDDIVSVYKESNGIYGYIGATEGSSIEDRNVIPNLSNTPPKGSNPFAEVGDYPSTVAFHEQRLYLGRTRNRPNAAWASQPFDPENFDVSRPAKPDDALSFALLGRRVNALNQLVSSTSLLALTTDSIYSVTGANGNAIAPDGNIVPKKQSSRGATRLRALDVDDVVLFSPERGNGIRALGYTFEIDGYQSNDLSIFSAHFFEDDHVVSWAYQAYPNSTIWAVTALGYLLAFTWEREQEVWGFTRCETDGYFERVAVVTEAGADRVYFVVRRTIAGQERRFFEVMSLPHTDDITLACPLDCAAFRAYDPPSAVIKGLHHLEGQEVRAYADGFEVRDLIVSNGRVTLPFAATVAFVGLPFACELETLPPALNTNSGSLRTNRQTYAKAVVRTLDSRGLAAKNTRAEFFDEVLADVADPVIPNPNTGAREYEISLDAAWSSEATISVRQEASMPAHILSVYLEPDVSND